MTNISMPNLPKSSAATMGVPWMGQYPVSKAWAEIIVVMAGRYRLSWQINSHNHLACSFTYSCAASDIGTHSLPPRLERPPGLRVQPLGLGHLYNARFAWQGDIGIACYFSIGIFAKILERQLLFFLEFTAVIN
nr:hypothetical protein [Formivibrio citricus]